MNYAILKFVWFRISLSFVWKDKYEEKTSQQWRNGTNILPKHFTLRAEWMDLGSRAEARLWDGRWDAVSPSYPRNSTEATPPYAAMPLCKPVVSLTWFSGSHLKNKHSVVSLHHICLNAHVTPSSLPLTTHDSKVVVLLALVWSR